VDEKVFFFLIRIIAYQKQRARRCPYRIINSDNKDLHTLKYTLDNILIKVKNIFEEELCMSDKILDINMIPEFIFSHIKTKKVKLQERNGVLILTPVEEKEKSFEHLIGMFSDGKLSIDNYLREKRLEKELEN
jgi:hypothetical protein